MISIAQRQFRIKTLVFAGIACLAVLMLLFAARLAYAATEEPEIPASGRLITVYDRGMEQSFVSEAATVREALEGAGIAFDPRDTVEPALDEELVAEEYTVNVYRARPVVVVDGASRQKIMTSAQTPEKIAESADVKLYEEDDTTTQQSDNLLTDGAAMEMVIERATAFTFTLYGDTMTARTQAETVGEFLQEQGITMEDNDRASLDMDEKITEKTTLRIWREGKQTITVDESVPFETEEIEDANRKVGYRAVRTAGKKGVASVTYEVTIRDGKEVARKKITSVTKTQPEKEVVVVGSKPSFDGDFAAALAKLRSCEGGYESWNPAGPYYGAYQFDQGTWASVSSAPYGDATPAEQDAAARALYERRGWSPWPHCGASLPDIYR